jgi:alpha-amylase
MPGQLLARRPNWIASAAAMLVFLLATQTACLPTGPVAAVTVAAAASPTASTAVSGATLTPPPTPRSEAATATVTPVRAAIRTPAWFRDVVLYEVFPRSFYDANDDGIGDLKGVTAKLGYLQELGVGAIWLTPIFASPSYHGYDVTDHYRVNPDFGNEADLVELVRQAHRRNIRVLLDFVAPHTSDQHPFFKDAYGNLESRYADWYRWTDPLHVTYESFAGVQSMPTLNHDNPEVQDYLIGVAKYWMKTGIDGYRFDYVLNVPHAFWKRLRVELKAVSPDFLLLAEAWTTVQAIKPYFDDEFDAAFDFPVYHDIQGNQDRIGDSLLLGKLAPQLMETNLNAEPILFPDGAQRVEFLNNHDTNRTMSEVQGDARRARLAATLLMTLPGTPMVYYGEEIGMSGVKAPAPDYDKTRREPMDWYTAKTGPGMTTWYRPEGSNNQPNDGVSVEEEQGQASSLLEHYRALVALRNANSALRTGQRLALKQPGDSKVYAYLRRDAASAFLVVLNFGDQPELASLDLSTASLAAGQYDAVDRLSGAVVSLKGATLELVIAAAHGYVFQLVPR